MMQKFLVGGAVRDLIMGKTPNDFDFSVVLHPAAYTDPYQHMVDELDNEGFHIFIKPDGTPVGAEHFTVRANFPKGHKMLKSLSVSNGRNTLGADFVLARREGGYSDGRRPDWVEPGTLKDDLSRRDFTMNAIAMDDEGRFIDPFRGQNDIKLGVIRAVGNAKDRMMEDSLRVLRALRFKIQLGFKLDLELEDTLFDMDVLRRLHLVSDERKMDELNKMFKANSLATIRELNHYHALGDITFAGKVNLEATMKTKGFK